jgi:predicted fused transcriptional regulator/phosphomethylpyrimidine kinase
VGNRNKKYQDRVMRAEEKGYERVKGKRRTETAHEDATNRKGGCERWNQRDAYSGL